MFAMALPFEPPSEKIPPFRRDQLPIHVQTMSQLSRDLLIHASASGLDTPDQRRVTAKSLALAQAMDPENQKVQSLILRLGRGEKPDTIEPEHFERAQKRIWNVLKWLEAAEAGSDANLLAALIGETIYAIDPKDERYSKFSQFPEHRAWHGWVADLAAFKKAPVIEKPSVPDEPIITQPEIQKEVTIALKKARLTTVLNCYDRKKDRWVPAEVDIRMKTNETAPPQEDGSPSQFQISIPARSSDYWPIQQDLVSPIGSQLRGVLGDLPLRGEIQLLVGENESYSFKRNASAASGPFFILAHAALSGVEPEGIVLAEIDQNKGWKLPRFFWRSLIALSESDGGGGRLIVPAAAEPLLMNFLALEQPDFFLKHEILLAKSTEDFIALTRKEPSAAHAEVFEKFKIITEKAEGKPTGVYLANHYVRQRLQEVAAHAPYHLSAKALCMQPLASRPRVLTEQALAAEIWRTVDVVRDFEHLDPYSLDSNKIEALDDAYEAMRDRLKSLERYTGTQHSALLKEAKDLSVSVRGVYREINGRGEIWEKYDKIMEAKNEMVEANKKLTEKLSKLSGDPLPK